MPYEKQKKTGNITLPSYEIFLPYANTLIK